MTLTITPARYMAMAALAVLACCAMDIHIYEYQYGFENHSIQIPYLLKWQNPALYPGDRLMAAMDDYFSYFWPFLGWLSGIVPLERCLFAGHVIVLLLRYSAVFAIGARSFPNHRWVPFLCLWVHLWGETVLGGESLHWYYLTHTTVAAALGLWAVYFGVAGWWVAAFGMAGFIFNIHAMQSAYLVLMLGLAALPDLRQRWRVLLAAGLCYAVAASPGIWWMLNSGALGSPTDLGLLIRAFYPVHFFPSAFDVYIKAGIALMMVLYVVPAMLLPRTGPVVRLSLMALAIIVLWIVGGVLLENFDVGFLIKMHIYRASAFFASVVFVLVSGWYVIWLLPSLPRSIRTPAMTVGLALAINLGSFNFLRYEQLPIGLAVAVAALLILVAIIARSVPVRGVALGVATALLLVVGIHQQRTRHQNMHDYFWWLGQWVEAQKWAQENSEPGDLFLTPPDMSGFRVFSQRPVVFEWFDGAAMLWDAGYADYWRGWYLRIGAKFRGRYDDSAYVRLGDMWGAKSRAEIEAIARSEGARYIVARPPHRFANDHRPSDEWADGKLFDNGSFFIVRVPGAPP